MVPRISKEENLGIIMAKKQKRKKVHVEGVGEGDVEEVIGADVADLRPDAEAMAKAQI